VYDKVNSNAKFPELNWWTGTGYGSLTDNDMLGIEVAAAGGHNILFLTNYNVSGYVDRVAELATCRRQKQVKPVLLQEINEAISYILDKSSLSVAHQGVLHIDNIADMEDHDVINSIIRLATGKMRHVVPRKGHKRVDVILSASVDTTPLAMPWRSSAYTEKQYRDSVSCTFDELMESAAIEIFALFDVIVDLSKDGVVDQRLIRKRRIPREIFDVLKSRGSSVDRAHRAAERQRMAEKEFLDVMKWGGTSVRRREYKNNILPKKFLDHYYPIETVDHKRLYALRLAGLLTKKKELAVRRIAATLTDLGSNENDKPSNRVVDTHTILTALAIVGLRV
jgi:hypothetical protein